MIGNLISALIYLEENFICHRDIKSDNIFIKFKKTGQTKKFKSLNRL